MLFFLAHANFFNRGRPHQIFMDPRYTRHPRYLVESWNVFPNDQKKCITNWSLKNIFAIEQNFNPEIFFRDIILPATLKNVNLKTDVNTDVKN